MAAVNHPVGGSHGVDGVPGEALGCLPDLRLLAGLLIHIHHLEIFRLEIVQQVDEVPGSEAREGLLDELRLRLLVEKNIPNWDLKETGALYKPRQEMPAVGRATTSASCS